MVAQAPVQQAQSYQPRPTQAQIRAQPVVQEQPNIIVNVVIPESVQRGIIACSGNDAVMTDDGGWIILKDGRPFKKMKPALTGPTI